MKAITIKQPHAQLILLGEKTIELRSWTTKYRGPLLICAGARPELDLAYPTGVALCIVDLDEITDFLPEHSSAARSRWRRGLKSWHLRHARPVRQFPVRGQLGFFEVVLNNCTGENGKSTHHLSQSSG